MILTHHLTSKTILAIGQAPKKHLSQHQHQVLAQAQAQGQAQALVRALIAQLGKNVAHNSPPNRLNNFPPHRQVQKFKTINK